MKSILKYPEDNQYIQELVRALKKNDQTISFTNGCFDLLHIGHLKVLNEAKKEGDVLIVGLNSDQSVKEFKGVSRPIVNQEDRSTILTNLRCVDFVIIYDEPSVYNLVKFIKPDVLVKGGEYKLEEVVGHDVIQSYNGKIVLVPVEENRSTTKTIHNIKKTSS